MAGCRGGQKLNRPREFDFDERMAMSQGTATGADLREILLRHIPGAVNAIPAHSSNDRNGTDWWVEHCAGKFLSVDTKVREQDWAATHPDEDDLALESWSVVESNVPGWTRDKGKRTDYVLWLWIDTGRWCLVPFPMLCAVFAEHMDEWRSTYKTRRQCTVRRNGSSYHSECVFVPRAVLWLSIYRRYAGKLL